MPNWCYNHIRITGKVENMKPIYDYFLESQEVVKEWNKRRNEILTTNPKAENDIDELCPVPKDNYVMSTLVPHDKEYKKIEETHDYILVPQDKFYGTKWDFDFMSLVLSDDDIVDESISFSVESAWSPPEAFCKRLSKKYGVEVYIQFEEGGCDFAGFAKFNNGKQVEAKTFTFLEGIYYSDKHQFFEEAENYAQTSVEEDEPLSKFLANFPFVKDKDDIGELTEMYHNAAEE
jgi:hypothetical protein